MNPRAGSPGATESALKLLPKFSCNSRTSVIPFRQSLDYLTALRNPLKYNQPIHAILSLPNNIKTWRHCRPIVTHEKLVIHEFKHRSTDRAQVLNNEKGKLYNISLSTSTFSALSNESHSFSIYFSILHNKNKIGGKPHVLFIDRPIDRFENISILEVAC